MDWRAGCAMYLCMKSSKHTPTVSFFFLFNLQYTMQKKSAILKYWWLVTIQASEEFNFSFRFQLHACLVWQVVLNLPRCPPPMQRAHGLGKALTMWRGLGSWVVAAEQSTSWCADRGPRPSINDISIRHSEIRCYTALLVLLKFGFYWFLVTEKHCSFAKKYYCLFFKMECRKVHIFLLK